jgi:hypothetical protein
VTAAGNRTNHPVGAAHPAWKGSAVGYSGIHMWVANNFTRPKACETCGASDRRFEWANKSGKYTRERSDWLSLCVRCHRTYDGGLFMRNAQKTHCVHGHAFTPANTYVRTDGTGRRICRACANDRSREHKRRAA